MDGKKIPVLCMCVCVHVCGVCVGVCACVCVHVCLVCVCGYVCMCGCACVFGVCVVCVQRVCICVCMFKESVGPTNAFIVLRSICTGLLCSNASTEHNQ